MDDLDRIVPDSLSYNYARRVYGGSSSLAIGIGIARPAGAVRGPSGCARGERRGDTGVLTGGGTGVMCARCADEPEADIRSADALLGVHPPRTRLRDPRAGRTAAACAENGRERPMPPPPTLNSQGVGCRPSRGESCRAWTETGGVYLSSMDSLPAMGRTPHCLFQFCHELRLFA
jgi:hypothetical protein